MLPRAAFPELTGREREILGLIARGKSRAAIMAALGISPKTLANHVSNFFGKPQVVDRAQAVLRAQRSGETQWRGVASRSCHLATSLLRVPRPVR